MKRLLISAALAMMAGTFAIGSAASAQPYRDYDRHDHDRHYEGRHYDRHDRYDRYDRYDDRRYDRGYNRGYDRGYHRGWRERSDWRRGGYVSYNDWHRGYYVDYRRYHLRQPPRGYEWRRVDDNYVLAAVATGLIASIILSN